MRSYPTEIEVLEKVRDLLECEPPSFTARLIDLVMSRKTRLDLNLGPERNEHIRIREQNCFANEVILEIARFTANTLITEKDA